jgi:hypothetical protein
MNNFSRSERDREILCNSFWGITVRETAFISVNIYEHTWTPLELGRIAAFSVELAAEAQCSMPGKTYHCVGSPLWSDLNKLIFFVPTSGVKCSLTKVDWRKHWLYCTKSGWRCIGCFPPALAYNLYNPTTNGNFFWGKQGPIHEEMSQTLLTNKKQGKLD